MPITRAKATQLLNKREMALYDDSRVNALRKLDAKALASRIPRARDARDRARDLLRTQKLSSRARTGSKRGTSGTANQRSKDKAELMADILKRFETRAREAAREARADAKPEAKRTVTRNAAKKAAPARAAGRRTAPAAGATAKRAAAGTAAKKPASTSRKPRKLTPEQALAQTQALLEAKHAREAEPKPWRDGPEGAAVVGQPGFQSDAAARRALRLHAAEARIPAIQGSISTRDRINQGKRDHRQDDD
ncbi:MAG: hypothetical protein KA124_02540 [Luteimonas sp.]|nr:hypothetical protein [Luteimonas sp.]